MTDPLLGAAASEVAKAGGGVLSRLLGPTADEMGSQLQEWYKRKNVERVAKRAEEKADTEAEGAIPPRVAAEVFEKAQWADNEFVAEYLSGVLATARTPEGKDDRAISWTALVGRLSSDQLRLHYILYRGLRTLSLGQEWESLAKVFDDPLVLPYSTLMPALGFPGDDEGIVRLLEAVYGLRAEDLVANDLAHGPGAYMNETNPDHRFPQDAGTFLITSGTTRGALLFLQAHGRGKEWASALVDEDEHLVIEWPEGHGVPPVDVTRMSTYKTSPESASA